MTQNEEARSHADDTYARMRSLIDTMASVPGEFSLEELAGLAVSMADHDALVRMAMDMLLHKGRQHCGGKIRRPDGEEGVMNDEDRGRFPRAVPVDRRGRSVWVGWEFSDGAQRYDAAHRRSAQSRGLDIEAQRIQAAIEIEAQRRTIMGNSTGQPLSIISQGDGVVIAERGDSIIIGVDPARSYNIDDPDSAQVRPRPRHDIDEKVWEGGGWLRHATPASY
jgi:hypothetical protein